MYGLIVDGETVKVSESKASLQSFRSKNRIRGGEIVEVAPGTTAGIAVAVDTKTETEEEAARRISLRYRAMERMTDRLSKGELNSLIVSGPPGLGKSYTMRDALARNTQTDVEYDLRKKDREQLAEMLGDEDTPYRYTDWIGGGVSAVGLYKSLWNCSNGGILVLDDADEIFRDEVSLNLLKVALDSSPTRYVSWRRESSWLRGEDEEIPDRFDFQGHVCFITNVDFEKEIATGRRDAEHYKALIDRSMYLCLTLRETRDFMIRIRQVAAGEDGMLVKNFGLTVEQSEEALAFIDEHKDRFYNLSLRLAGQIAVCMTADPDGWQEDIEATKMRTL